MKPVLIIRTGRAPDNIRARHGDFAHWFRLSAGVPQQRIQVIDVVAGAPLPDPRDVAGAIITGSAAMVTEQAAWSEHTSGWVRNAMDAALPLFGVCYGHQLMAHALGGRVGYLPGGREIGTESIERLTANGSDALADSLPQRFRAHTTHEQSVLELPTQSVSLGRSARDPNQLVRHGPNAVSVQFHPEFSADVMRAYVRRKHRDLHREGADPVEIFRNVAATPRARGLLQRFATIHGWTLPTD